MNNGQMDRSNENITLICSDDWVKPWKNSSQVGWDQGLNSETPKFESSVLPLRHLTRWRSFCFVEYHHVKDFAVDPGGLGVIILASGSDSERKNLEYDFLPKGSKAVCP